MPLRPEDRARRRKRRIGTIAASLVVVGGTAGMAAAASGALPGEPLYPIKRGIEQVTTAVRLDDASQGRALLDQAATRLQEVRDLQAQGSADPDLVAETLDAFTRAADEGSQKLFTSYQVGGDQADIITVRDFAAAQMSDLARLTTTADTATNDLLLGAADTLADIDEQARAMCGACGADSALTPPRALGAVAGAATMANLIARPVSQARADISAAQAARIKALKGSAEKSAVEIPQLPTSGGATAAGLPGYTGKPGAPITSTITSDGKLLPTVTSGAAVPDLVSGVTGVVDQATGGVTAPVTKPLDDTVKKLDDTVGDATDQLLP